MGGSHSNHGRVPGELDGRAVLKGPLTVLVHQQPLLGHVPDGDGALLVGTD